MSNGKLVSAKTGKAVVLRGVSLHGLAWYPQYVDKSVFRTLRRTWKANAVRLPLYTEEYGGYCSGGNRKRLLQLVDNGVRYATENDMYVIIDWHTLHDANPNKHVAAAKRFFATVAKKYRKHNNVIFEICNEPNGSTTWASVKKYAKRVIPQVRKFDKNAIILLGTPEWCQRIDQAARHPLPKKYARNVMYTFHFYAATHKADLRNRLKTALEAKVPVFVSEYGISEASGSGALDKAEARRWMRLLTSYKVGRCIWNLSNKNESSALVKTGVTYKGLRASGKWAYKAIRKAW